MQHLETQRLDWADGDLGAREPVLHPGDVFPRHLEDTLEEAVEGFGPPVALASGPVRGDVLYSPAVETWDVEPENDTVLVAIGAGLVSSMLAVLLMLFSGYGAI